jgi:putative membrane-bound dehydrogenase-like protein
VAPGQGGVFVAAPPDIWYMKDTDGDFKADVKRRVFTGFGLDNQQAMVNNLQFGLDHKIYGSTAGNGGEIRPGDDPTAKPISVKGRDFRFDPATGQFETVTGTVQFGNTFDDWGNRFVCSESQPLSHIVLPEEYLVRNPFLATPSAIQNVAPGPVPIYRISPIERWREIRSSRRIAKNERAAASPGASHHVVDAAAGVTIYRGGAYPPEYYGQVFVGDGQNNLVHRRELIPDGVTFQSKRVDDKTEFVRSSDIWFRPVNFVNAPDGTLYCLDMSREVLESIHIPLDVVKHLDLKSGRDNGRIYRIAPPKFRSPPPPRLSKATSAELVAALESPQGWWRDTAHRLIYERKDKSVVPALRKLARESRFPPARLHALWSLDGLKSLDDETLILALGDSVPGIRENALRLAEKRLEGNSKLLEAVLGLVDDEMPRVRFQAAFSLGEAHGKRAAAALARMARRDGGDQWMRAAILSSAGELAGDLFDDLMRDHGRFRKSAEAAPFATTGTGAAILGQLSNLIGVRNRQPDVDRVLEALVSGPIANQPAVESLLIELGRGLKRAGGRLAYRGTKSTVGDWLQAQLNGARLAAADTNGDQGRELRGIELASCAASASTRETFLSLIRPDQPETIQIAAVRALSDDPDRSIAGELLSRFNSFTPEVRRIALEALLAREERTLALLEAASRDEVSLADVEPTRRDVLVKHKNEAIRKLAAALFAASGTGSPKDGARKEVLAQYQAALTLPAKGTDGQIVFEKNCANCHQLGGKGYAIGPNLASSPSRDGAVLLTHILDPSQYVLPNFVQYVVVDKQGRSFSGLVAAQTATSVTLKKEKDESVTILRRDIEEMATSGKSLMPEGLEKSIGVQEMANLLAYLREAATGDSNAERDFGTLPGLIETKETR